MHRRSNTKSLLRTACLAIIGIAAFTTAASASTTLPPRKPGLWETTMMMKMTMNGQPMGAMGNTPIISDICTSAATDAAEMKKMAGDNGRCAKFDIEGSGDTYTMDGSCTDPLGGTMTTHGVITKQSDTAFHVESETTSPHISGHMTGDSKWLGACPAGVAAGDMGTMQNGQFVKRTNIFQNAQPH